MTFISIVYCSRVLPSTERGVYVVGAHKCLLNRSWVLHKVLHKTLKSPSLPGIRMTHDYSSSCLSFSRGLLR